MTLLRKTLDILASLLANCRSLWYTDLLRHPQTLENVCVISC